MRHVDYSGSATPSHFLDSPLLTTRPENGENHSDGSGYARTRNLPTHGVRRESRAWATTRPLLQGVANYRRCPC
jgi:hypothetical protein